MAQGHVLGKMPNMQTARTTTHLSLNCQAHSTVHNPNLGNFLLGIKHSLCSFMSRNSTALCAEGREGCTSQLRELVAGAAAGPLLTLGVTPPRKSGAGGESTLPFPTLRARP